MVLITCKVYGKKKDCFIFDTDCSHHEDSQSKCLLFFCTKGC